MKCLSKSSCMVFLLMLLTIKISAQSKTIYIIDSLTKIPIQSATLQSNTNDMFLLTNENGAIYLNNKATNIKISCIGYNTKIVELNHLVFTNDEAIICLLPALTSLQEITLSATAKNNIFKTISDWDIHLRPINNSQEVLRMIPGLFIGQHAGGGKAEQIFLRGFDLDHGTDINITVDGLPVNMVSHAHGQGYADLHFVIPELIDKVNFNKGSHLANKGNFTTAGFVEFKTKDYLKNDFVKLEGGQFSTYRAIAGINLLPTNKKQVKQSLYIAGEGSFTRGYFENPQDFSRFNSIIKYHGTINKNNSLTTSLTAFTSKWNASGQIPNRAVESGLVGFYGAIDNTEGGKTSRYNFNTELLTNLNNGATLRNQIFYSKYAFELYSNFTFFKEDPIKGDQIRQKENRDIIGYNATYQNTNHIGKYKGEIQAGIQLRYDLVKGIELTRTVNRTTNTKQIMLGNINEFNGGAFFSNKIYLSNKFDVTVGVRSDVFTNKYEDKLAYQTLNANATIICPKLNFNYKVSNTVQLYLNNGKGFHSNDTRVATLQDGKKVLPPAYGSDIGGIFKLNKNFILHTAIWYLWLDQEFIYVGDEGVVEAGGRTKRYGIDVSARYEMLKNLYIDADISLAKPQTIGVAKEERYLPLAPTFTSVGGFTYRKAKGINGSLRYRLMGDRPANETNTVIAKGYFVVDFALNYTAKKYEIGLSIQNLLNTKWKETQFDTESQLKNETSPVSEIHFTAGTPLFARLSLLISL